MKFPDPIFIKTIRRRRAYGYQKPASVKSISRMIRILKVWIRRDLLPISDNVLKWSFVAAAIAGFAEDGNYHRSFGFLFSFIIVNWYVRYLNKEYK